MIKVVKINESLNLSFNYDVDVIGKVKSIPGRKYNPDNKSWDIPLYAIKLLLMLFDENDLDISDDIELDYEKPKYNFKHELNTIENNDLREFAKWGLDMLPDYFYQVAASSSGKYHPSYAQGDDGLVRHTQAAVRIANELFKCDTIHSFDSYEKDVIRVALLLHDGVKHGTDGSAHTVSTHPLEVVKYLEDKYYEVDEESLPPGALEVMESKCGDLIFNCIKSHMGQWNTDYKSGEEILPKPTNEIEKFTHLCDYLASRKLLEVNFNMEG
ncbi:MAG: HD domain-containing protein [Sarcina sp.]